MRTLGIARSVALATYFGLASTLIAWNAWLEPAPAALTLLVLPLLFPLRGLLRGHPYTHAWASFLALGYFVVGVWHAAVESERVYGLWIVTFSLLFFVSALAYIRLNRERGLA